MTFLIVDFVTTAQIVKVKRTVWSKPFPLGREEEAMVGSSYIMRSVGCLELMVVQLAGSLSFSRISLHTSVSDIVEGN
jgi:hypothetical protein